MMERTRRLPSGGRIDRTRPLPFFWNGTQLYGYEGDTLASALLANGVSTVARSFKYHRRRGILAAGADEPNALCDVGEGALLTPNLKATQVPLYAGLAARSINCWPGVGFDLGAAIQLVGRFLPAGFYYKTFMWPSWHLWEPLVRHAAGLGRAPVEPDPEAYRKRRAHCDVLVVGAGPAGLAAALAAGRAGARVILADEQEEMGGALLFEDETIDDRPALDWVAAGLRELSSLADVTLLPRTTVFGYYDHNALGAVQRLAPPGAAPSPSAAQLLWKIRAREVVLATGALERPVVFERNDLPGVMLAAAVRHYLRRYAVVPGERAVVFANNDDAYRTALALRDAGAAVTVLDSRAASGGHWPAEARRAGIEIRTGAVVARALGRSRVAGVELGDGTRLEADLLAVSGGYNPAVHLFSQSGGSLRYDEALAAFVPGRSVQRERSAGAANGAYELAVALAEGTEAGAAAAERAGFGSARPTAPRARRLAAGAAAPLWHVEGGDDAKAWVDLLSDVTAADVALAARENYVSVEHLKRYTTTGMSPDQGKTSNVNALAILGALTGRAVPEVGTTRFRPPYDPVRLGAVAGAERGDLYRPRLLLPCHARHVEAGAVIEDYGGWQRPSAYPRGRESFDAAIQREAAQVRRAVGLFDGSPLGKIEVEGPDAATFLDRIYVGTVSTLPVGRVRYGLMLNENGIIIDDGVVARLGPERFLVGTSSGGAGRIAAMLDEWLQCEWPALRVFATNATQHWAVVTLTGPRAREVLAALGTDIDLAPSAFPHMSWREGSVAGIAARVFRVSFTGEVSYEINVPARAAPALWQKALEAGAAAEVTPFGVEALMVLRIEKGYIHVGSETDGTSVPDDVGMAGGIARKTSDFAGRRSLLRPEARREGRRQLVGLVAENPTQVLPAGAHVAGAEGSEGWVTSSCFSPTLGRGVALAMLRDGRRRHGERVEVVDEGRRWRASVVAPCFVDPRGMRLNA